MYTKNAPHKLNIDETDKVYICNCGKSAKPPFCDGSHKGTGMAPVIKEVESGDTLFICGCGKSKNMPYCDGSHKDV
jgi:CDGSH-type Zn-finger protein